MLVLSIVLFYGGGSVWLQGIAWLTMVPEQIVTSGSIEQGLKNTFNGKHACALCKAAAQLRAQEAQQELVFFDPSKDASTSPNAPKKSGKKKEQQEKKGASHKLIGGANAPFHVTNAQQFCGLRATAVLPALSVDLEVDIPPPKAAVFA